MSINSLYSKLSTLVETKSLLRQAIIDKGVPVRKDRDTFRDYVTKINNIVQESPHGLNAPYIDDHMLFCEDYSKIGASKMVLHDGSTMVSMVCPFTLEASFIVDGSVTNAQTYENFVDFHFGSIGSGRVENSQDFYLIYGEYTDSSSWNDSTKIWLADSQNPHIIPRNQVVTITCVRYSDRALFYMNGVLIDTVTENYTPVANNNFSIYRTVDLDNSEYHSAFNTTINSVRVYNKALNENEIYYNYSIDLLNNGNTQYLNTNHIKSGLVYGVNPILPLTGINSHDDVSNYNNHFDNLSIPISLQNGFTIEWRGSISDIMSNDNEPYDYTGRLFTFKNSNGTDTFEVCATIDSEDTDIFDISFKASDEYLTDSEDWLEVFSDTLPSIKFSSDFTLSITVSSTAVNVYINGILEASSSTYQNKFTNANLWKILYLFTNSLESPLQGTDGFLYSLRIYNRVLNEYEINYNYKVDTRSDIKNPDPLYGKAILGELGNMTLNASGVIIPKAFNCSKPFEIVSCFKMKSDESENDKNFALFGSSDALNYSAYPSIEIRPYTNKLWVGVSINPNNWTYTQEVDLSNIPIVYDNNVLNWIKMEYDGDKIYLSHSIDCLSWTRFHTITGIVPYNPVTNDYTLIFGAKLQNSELTYTYKSNGETSFSFMNSWVKSCNKTIWGREIMGQELYTNNSTVLVPNGDVRYNAGSFIAYPNLDMSDDFEVVICLAIDKTAMTSSQTYYLAGGITSSTSNFRMYATYYNIGYQIFYGTHTVAEDDVSWEDTVSNFIYNEGVQNFLKLKKRDGKVSFYHSLDAINWSLLNEVEINSETFTNLQDDGIRFGNAGSDTSTALPMTDTSFINLHNSYVKVNGEVVWGREIREKAQVYAPVLKREVTLYKPDISQFTGGDNVIENLAIGNCSIPVYDVDKYQDYLNFNKKYNSKLIIPANPLSYDKTCLSFTIKFPSPNVGYWNSIVGVNAKKTIPNDTSNTFVNFLYISSASSSYIDNDKKGVRLIVANTKRVIRTNDTIVSSANTNDSSPYESYLILSQTLFPVSGWNIDIGFKLEFDNIHNTITLSIDNTEAAVVELNDNIEYLYQPVGITFGYFDDNKISSPSSLTMYIKDIEYTIEGSVSKNMIERIECTSEEYLSESSHNDQILYNVTYPDNSVKQFLGNKELGGTVESIRYHEAVLYKPDISGFVSGDTEIYNLGVGNGETQLVNVTKYNDYLCFPKYAESKFDFMANPMAYDKTQISFVTRFDEPSKTWNSIFGINAEKTNPDKSRSVTNFLYMSLVSDTNELVERRGLRIYLYANGIVRSNSDIISNIRNESPLIWIFFNKTLFPLSGWTSDVKFDLKFNNINHTLSIFIDDIEAIVVSLFEICPYNRYPVKAVFGWFDDMDASITNQSLYFKDIEYKVEGGCSVDMFDEIDCTPSEYYSLESYDDHRVYNVNYQDGTIRRFLGDEEIGVEPSETLNTFTGYALISPTDGSSSFQGYIIPNTATTFDTSKDFDIIVAFYITSNTGSNSWCLYGTGYNNKFYEYPTMELTQNNGLWFGFTIDGTTWNIQDEISYPNNLMVLGALNYYKISYTKNNHTIIIAHSLDGVEWENIYIKDCTSDLNGQEFYNSTIYDFSIGTNALENQILFPKTADNHICVERCKIISQGKIIYGFDSKKISNDGATIYEFNCTSEIYNSLPIHDSHTIYTVVYPNGDVRKYLGDDSIGSTLNTAGNDIEYKNYANENHIFNNRNVIYELPCTAEKYNAMGAHSSNILYSVLQSNGSVYKYLGDYQVGAILKDNCPVQATKTLDGNKTYISTLITIDQTKDFEFVYCLRVPSGNYSANVLGNTTMTGIGSTIDIGTVSTYNNPTNKGASGFQFFDTTGGWGHTQSLDMSSVIIADGITKNYLKLVRKGDTLFGYYSYDGVNYIFKNQLTLDTSIPLSTEAPIYLGNAYNNGNSNMTISKDCFCVSECYLKQEGKIVYGNEIIPVDFSDIDNNIYEYNTDISNITILKSIKSTGNSIIPTNLIPNYDWSIYLDAKFDNLHNNHTNSIVCGVNQTDEHFLISVDESSGTSSYIAYSGFTPESGDVYSVDDIDIGERQNCILRKGNAGCVFGNKSFVMSGNNTDSIPDTPIMIGGYKGSSNILPFNTYDLTIYGMSIVNSSNEVIHNLVPAQSNISGRAGLYDLITEVFYQSDSDLDDFEKEFIYDDTSISNYFDAIVAPVTFLKSVKSVGNSVVQTDIALDFDWEVHMSVMFSGTRKSTSPTYSFFGVGGSDPWFTAESADGTSVAFYIGFDNNSNPAITFNGMEPNTIIPIVARRNGNCICGTEYDSISDSVTGNPHSFGAAFFGVSTGSSTVLPFAYYDMTIYNIDIVDSTGSIIHKLVPAENNVGRGGLFDLVTNKFYPADNRYDDLVKDYGSNATRSPYNVYRILNPGEYKQNGMMLSLSDFTDNANYYTYTLPIASSAGFTFEINLSFGDFENRSGLSSSDNDDGHPVVTLFDSRNDAAPNNDRYGLRIICYSDNSYGVELHKNNSWIFSRNFSTPLYIPRGLHTFTMTVENNGIAKAYVDGEFWISTAATGNIGILTRKFYIFTNANASTGWTLYPQYRSVNRVMLYNRALTEQEILENRKADIVNFGE